MMDRVVTLLPSYLNNTISLGNHFTKEVKPWIGCKISRSVPPNKRTFGYPGARVRSCLKDPLPQECIKEKTIHFLNDRITAERVKAAPLGEEITLISTG